MFDALTLRDEPPPNLLAAGFPLLATMDAPHWTVALSAPTSAVFASVRVHFDGPVENPAWAGPGASVR